MFNRGPIFTLLAVVALFAIGCSSQSPTAPQANLLDSLSSEVKLPKVAVCHIDDEGNYILININGNALDAHLAHGDGLPGENGLDENCVEVPIPDDFVTFVDINAQSFGEYNLIEWTVEGTPERVTYYLEGFDPSSGNWLLIDILVGSGEDTFQAADFFLFFDSYRVRAVDADGNEVTSPTVPAP